jgi:hypothetical protein
VEGGSTCNKKLSHKIVIGRGYGAYKDHIRIDFPAHSIDDAEKLIDLI